MYNHWYWYSHWYNRPITTIQKIEVLHMLPELCKVAVLTVMKWIDTDLRS